MRDLEALSYRRVGALSGAQSGVLGLHMWGPGLFALLLFGQCYMEKCAEFFHNPVTHSYICIHDTSVSGGPVTNFPSWIENWRDSLKTLL